MDTNFTALRKSGCECYMRTQHSTDITIQILVETNSEFPVRAEGDETQ